MEGLDITEQEYRALEDRISYSLLSSVDRDKQDALTKVFIPTIPTKYGILTESILFGDYMEEDYYIFEGVAPTDKLKLACDTIFPNLSKEFTLEEHKVAIVSIIKGQAEPIDYYAKKDPEWIAEKIIKETSGYWDELVKADGKITIDNELLNKANDASHTLKTHDFTSDIFNKDTFGNVEKFSQVKLTFEYLSRDFKAMLDWLIIDHDNKVIKPYDLKTGGKTAEEFEASFFHWRYDIQGLLYTMAIRKLRDDKYAVYKIEPFRFVFISRNDVYRPLVWRMSDKQMAATLTGFTRRNKNYKGVQELIGDLDYYRKNQNLDYAKDVYDNNGEMLIDNEIIINV